MSTPDQRESKDPRLFEEWMLGLVAGGVLFMSEHVIKKEIVDKRYLTMAANHVNQRQGGLLVVANHLSMIDALAMRVVRDEIDTDIEMGVFWANKFTGKDAGKYQDEDSTKMRRFGKIGEKLADRSGIQLLAVPQEATRDRNAMRAGAAVIEAGREMVQDQAGVLGIFPEGTRSRNGVLGPVVESAVGRVTKGGGENQWVLPVGIVGSNKVLTLDNKFHLAAPMTIRFGRPVSVSKLMADQQRHRLSFGAEVMLQIAKVLPESMWGVYLSQFREVLTKDRR
jgi:1-acyl-sn-glycerol-3-phosphate acyltransferase